MMHSGLLLNLLFILACASPQPPQSFDPQARDPAPQRVRPGPELLRLSTQAEDPETVRKLREDLAKAHLQNLDLKLRLARLAAKPDEELRTLEEALASEFPAVYAAALRELGALPEERRRNGVPAVLARYGRGEESFKVQAVGFLGRVPTPDAETTVLRAAADPSAAVRKAAAAALKTYPHERAVSALVPLLKDPDLEVKTAALDALGTAKRDAAVAPLAAALAAEKDTVMQEKTADALGVIGSPAAVSTLLDLLESTERREVRWSCINSLGKIGDPRGAARLRPYLGPDRTPDVRQIAAEALGKLKDAASLPALAAMLQKDPDDKLRQAAASSVGRIAPPDAIGSLLLPAWLGESSEPVRQAIWAAISALAGDSFPVNLALAAGLLKNGRRSEAEQVCASRLHVLQPEPDRLAGYLDLEESLGKAAFEARDAKSALGHFRQLSLNAPGRTDVAPRLAACYRELKDFENCIKTLREVEPRLPRGEAAWWANKLDLLAALREGKDAEPLAEEAYPLLLANPPAHPEDRKKALEQALRAAALRAVQPLEEKDEAARKAGLETARKLGKKIILALALELEESPKPSPAVIEAGNLIAGTTLDAATADPAKAKETAAAWRAWHEANRNR